MGFFNKNKNKKSCVPHGTKAKFFFFFLSLCIKTYLWAYTRIEKKGVLACIRNGPSHKITVNSQRVYFEFKF